MEFFKFLLFGIAGISMIFWVCVIAFWHVETFQKFFVEDRLADKSGLLVQSSIPLTDQFFGIQGKALRPNSRQSGTLEDRSKYFRKSFVVADFSPIDAEYSVNRLYTSILLSLGVMSFIVLTYGLHSGFDLFI